MFYIANHTFVQTRYLFVTAPLLTIALLALLAQHWPLAYRSLLAFALLYGAAMSLLATRPLVRNKVRLDAVWVELAAQLRALPYLWDPGDDRRNVWIYSQGAQYEIVDHAPLPSSTLLWSRPVPLTGWYLHPAMYSRTETLQLWKLPPPP